MKPKQETRQHETITEIHAGVDQVWKAITDASQVQIWYAPEARIDLRTGGEYFVSWGEGAGATGQIEVLEPPKHLRVVAERDSTMNTEEPEKSIKTSPVRVAIDFYLESHSDTTVLRLVHSGFLPSTDWDAEYHGTRKGWPIMLRILRYSLEHFGGAPGRQSWLYTASTVPLNDAWEAFTQSIASEAIKFVVPREEICATWAEMGDGLVYASFGENGGRTGINLFVVLYNEATPRIGEAAAYWRGRLATIFPDTSIDQ
jgi:uncharacterized protein YndB with AHSA1/START domain